MSRRSEMYRRSKFCSSKRIVIIRISNVRRWSSISNFWLSNNSKNRSNRSLRKLSSRRCTGRCLARRIKCRNLHLRPVSRARQKPFIRNSSNILCSNSNSSLSCCSSNKWKCKSFNKNHRLKIMTPLNLNQPPASKAHN